MRAFTLIEVLAVVALLSLGAAAGVVSLHRVSDDARLREADAVLRGADSRARELGRRGMSVVLRVEEGAVQIADGRERRVELPRGVAVEFLDLERGGRLDGVRFDGGGRSVDYGVTITGPGGVRSWAVAGLTGWTFDAPEVR